MSNNYHTDALGLPIKEGDLVAVTYAGTGTSYIRIKKVVGFTPKKIRLEGGALKTSDKLLLYTAQSEYNDKHFPEYFI